VKGVDQLLSSKIKIERLHIARRPYVDRRSFTRGKVGFELRDNVFGNFTLNCKDIRQIAVVVLSPDVLISSRVYQLRCYPDFVVRAANAAF